jgi:Copper amine oxidase N-terminal domain
MKIHHDKTQRQRRGRVAAWSAVGGATAFMLMGGINPATAQAIGVTVNGQPVQFQDIGPQQIEGRTLVPVRGVLEKLGASVAFDNRTQTVIASTPKIDIQLKIGSKTAIVNGNNVILDTPAQTIANHTFVPLRFLGEALGADVAWDSATRTVRIITKDALNAGGGPPSGPRPPVSRTTPDPDHRRDDNDPARRHNDNGPAPVINSFTQDAGRWLRAGETLHATLEGTPGGQASFRVPGLAEDIPMRETAPGRYAGAWEVPQNKPLQLKAAAVIGSLKIGNKMAPLLQAGETVSVDAVPPRAREFAPDEGASVNDPRPNISAVFEDQGSGLDRKEVRLLVNGRDVTGDATVTRDFISYRPAETLPAGPQRVELKIADIAGNRTEAHWTFTEQTREAGGIKSVVDNADHVLQPGDTIHVEMTGTSGGKATFSAGSLQNVPMNEAQPGHYVRDYTIRRGDDIADKPLAFRLVTPQGDKFEQASRRAIKVNTGKPTPPIVTSPGPNQAPNNPLVVRGKATPNSKVRVKVDYRNRVFGLVALQGTAADTTVTADKEGNWQTEPINIGGILGSKGVEYTISATSMNAADEKSDTTTTKFRIQ